MESPPSSQQAEIEANYINHQCSWETTQSRLLCKQTPAAMADTCTWATGGNVFPFLSATQRKRMQFVSTGRIMAESGRYYSVKPRGLQVCIRMLFLRARITAAGSSIPSIACDASKASKLHCVRYLLIAVCFQTINAQHLQVIFG